MPRSRPVGMLPTSSRHAADRAPANENTMQWPTSATRRSAPINACGKLSRPIASNTGAMSLTTEVLKAKSAFMVSSRFISGRLSATSPPWKRLYPLVIPGSRFASPGMTAAGIVPVSGASGSGHLVEEAGDAPDPAVLQHGEVGALDRAVDAVGAETPGEADVVAIAIGF